MTNFKSEAGLYKVTWEIEVEAGSPEEAARKALEVQRDPKSEALFFTVQSEDSKEVTDVDLNLYRIKSVTCIWSENSSLRDGREYLLSDFDQIAYAIAMSNPEDGGYDKVKVKVNWEDGDYEVFRLDLKRGGDQGVRQYLRSKKDLCNQDKPPLWWAENSLYPKWEIYKEERQRFFAQHLIAGVEDAEV